ncbi:MAG: hypothetical protein RBT69_02225 [Spirochaetia bacterium]|jgi:hypothetical protein|nr:hypothetical protein [Spirochaetia bacterium]
MNTIKSILSQLGGSRSETRKDLENLLNNYFIDPCYISCTDALKENDLLKIEAQIVFDAFEAVTNGMHDDETISQLSQISPDSFFSDWRYLTESLYNIYRNSLEDASGALEKIKPGSIPALLLPLLHVLIDKTGISITEELSEVENTLLREINRENRNFTLNLDLCISNLEEGKEDSFADSVTLIITDIFPKDPGAAENIAVWALKQLFSRDMSPELLIENIKLVFGETNSLKLRALALMDEDRELSLLFWIKTAISLLRKNSSDSVTIEAYLEIIEDLKLSGRKSDNREDNPDDALIAGQIENLFIVLDRELQLRYPQLSSRAESSAAEETAETAAEDKISTKTAVKKSTEKNKQLQPLQLELFA